MNIFNKLKCILSYLIKNYSYFIWNGYVFNKNKVPQVNDLFYLNKCSGNIS